MTLNNFQQIHFIGIGGSGISALAHLEKAKGHTVTGSDMGENPTINDLESQEIQVFKGHSADNINEACTKVIFTEAIDRETNPEYLEAKKRGIELKSYFEALGELSASKKTIVVTGTHGKTTTTAMLGQALIEAGMNPTVIVGSRVPAFNNRNIHIGTGDYLIAEGCEYRRSFLSFKPFGMILLNCELEHVDYYEKEEHYINAYIELANKLPTDGFLVYNADDENCRKVAANYEGRKYAIGPVTEKNLNLEINTFDVKDLKLDLNVPGYFNQLNAAHAYYGALGVMANEKEIGPKLVKAFNSFKGTSRRQEIKGEINGVMIMDDYGHHPTEIKATLKALKEKYPERRLVCVFQPHQYSRTIELLDEFINSFNDADQIIIPNIFEARDTAEDKEKVSAKSLAEQIPRGVWGDGSKKTLTMIKEILRSGDLLVTMGAGDVYKIGDAYLEL